MRNSIIILNYNSFNDVNNLLINNLLDVSRDFYIIVVDNSSSNREGEDYFLSLMQSNESIFYIKNKKNSGYAAGNNLGVTKAIQLQSEYTFILNPDVIIDDNNIFTNMLKEVTENNNIFLAGPRIDNICPYYMRPTLKSFMFPPLHRILEKRMDKMLNKYINTPDNTIYNVYKIYGCFMLLNIEKFKEIDLFDERTFLYGEENIIAEKLYINKLNMHYIPKYSISHAAQGSTKSLRYKQFQFMYASDFLYLHSYRKINVLFSHIISLNNIIFRIVINKLKGLI